MRCSTAKRYIDLKLDGELKARHADELSRHLTSCPSCRAWQAEAGKLQTLMQAAPAPLPPAWVHAQIMDKVLFKAKQRPGFVQRFRLATASAVVAVFFSFWAGTMVGVKSFHTPVTEISESSNITLSSLSFGENTLVDDWITTEDYNE